MELGTWNLSLLIIKAYQFGEYSSAHSAARTGLFLKTGDYHEFKLKNFLFTIYHVRIGPTKTTFSKNRSVFQKLSEKQQGRVYHFLFCGWHMHHSVEIAVSVTKMRFLHGEIFHIYFWFKVRYFTLVKIIQDSDTVKFIFSISSSIRRNYSSKSKTTVRAWLKCWEHDVRSRSWSWQFNQKVAYSLLDEPFIWSSLSRQTCKWNFFPTFQIGNFYWISFLQWVRTT